MHQHPRPPPATASPANSEQTNPYRSNNPRDRTPSTQASGSSEDFVTTRQEPDTAASMQRLNQVIQNFHTKAALIILHSRADLSPAYSSKTNEKRVNKWFNIELDETDDYLEDIKRWKRIDVQAERPPPLIIEVYLTTEALPQGQRLVILDDDQKRWDVYNALEPRQSTRTTSNRPEKSREILLERWTIELRDSTQPIPSDLPAVLPHVYKKSIVLFRALFTYCNFLPAWKLIRKLGKSRSTMGMKIGFRIVEGDRLDSIPRADNLNTSLYETSSPVTTDYSFGSTDSPAGPFSVQVKYRSNSDFRVDDSEELLSSRFIGADDNVFNPSWRDHRDEATQRVGSLPSDQRRQLMDRPELGQAYGSLATFHQAGINPSTSPISALRAQKELGGDSPSPQRPLPQQAQPTRPSPRTSTTTRRSSFSINPFKAPTLAASPLGSSPLGASPRVSAKAVPTLDSLQEEGSHPGPEARAAPAPKPSSTENVAKTSVSSSPRPAPVQRFQSSFSHRRNRLSVDRTTNKTDEDQTSSGKASAASSGQPGSGLMTEAARGGSSGSMHADDENISDFLKMLDQKKDKLTPASSSAVESSAKRTAAALNRFHQMRDSNAALSESMSSSLVVPKPSTPSSRQLPGQATISTSTSPGGKPVSPHTPHAPFAPSRLSAAYSHDAPEMQEGMQNDGATSPNEERIESAPTEANPGAIDIPNSPMLFKPGYRRSSSAQRRPLSSEDDIGDLYGMRSASMGANVKQQPSLVDEPKPLDLSSQKKETGSETRVVAADVSDSGSGRSSLPTTYRSRFSRGGAATRGGSHASPTQGSLSSIGGTGASVEKTADSGSASGSWGRGGRTQGLTRPETKTGEEEDDLPFLMDGSARS
ncbi:autophagy protein 13 [Knufia fluminis]|uniref:Autophagy-related protein 13 n=1 Tax=Knufia fluminis TaxID=191047 RepID=A0AAN8IBA4_9EURO|nr:autophagy protein 13 [Knufia fluminis]